MIFSFSKYHGTGNDFIMIDCTSQPDFKLSTQEIKQLCHRRFGIGADGIILILKHPTCDFKMVYYNSDGTQSFCGNGSRCAVKFAKSLHLFKDKTTFEAIDGIHTAEFYKDLISLEMNPVQHIKRDGEAYIIDTGSPHFIKFVDDITRENIVKFGQAVRYSETYKAKGINVNLVEIVDKEQLRMRTYERGVEDETYSCGTGAVAVAIAYANQTKLKDINLNLEVKGGNLIVKARYKNGVFSSISLIGPAIKVFQGNFSLSSDFDSQIKT